MAKSDEWGRLNRKRAQKGCQKVVFSGYPGNTENTENTENMKNRVLLAEMHDLAKLRKCQESEFTNFLDSFVTARSGYKYNNIIINSERMRAV